MPAKSCLFVKIVYFTLAFLLIALIANANPFIVKDGEARATYQKALAKPGLPKAWREAIEKKIR